MVAAATSLSLLIKKRAATAATECNTQYCDAAVGVDQISTDLCRHSPFQHSLLSAVPLPSLPTRLPATDSTSVPRPGNPHYVHHGRTPAG